MIKPMAIFITWVKFILWHKIFLQFKGMGWAKFLSGDSEAFSSINMVYIPAWSNILGND